MKRLFVSFFAVMLFLSFSVLMSRTLSAEEYIYHARGRRDPFMPLIISGTKTTVGLEVVETIDDIKFEGVIFDPFGKSIAMLNGEVVKERDKVYNVEVLKIYNDAVTIKIYDKTYTVNLIKEGGEAFER